MKIQKRLSRKYKDKEYYKYIIIFPEKDLKDAGFKEGDELVSDIKKGLIQLKKKR